MARISLKIGDVIKLKGRFKESGRFGIIIDITKAESFGEGGWISFDYLIMNEKEQLIHITESCVEKVYSRVVVE